MCYSNILTEKRDRTTVSRNLYYCVSQSFFKVVFSVFWGLLLSLSVQAETEKVRIALGSSITTDMIGRYLLHEKILKKWGENAEIAFDLTTNRNPKILLTQNKAEIVLLSTIDVARLISDDNLEIVIWGKESTSYESLYTKTSLPGLFPTSFKGKRLVHPGWDTRGTRVGQVILENFWGLDVETDFQVVTAPWRVGPEKLSIGEADIAISTMPFVLKGLQEGQLRSVGKSFAWQWAETEGSGRRLGGLFWVSWKNWLFRERKSALAFLGAWTEGMQYASVKMETWVREYLPRTVRGTGKKSTQFFLNWVRRERPFYTSPFLATGDIESENRFLRLAVKSKLIHEMPEYSMWKIIRSQ